MSVSVLVPTTGPRSAVAGHAALADELGYDSINCSHVRARDSFATLAALASIAPRVRLATYSSSLAAVRVHNHHRHLLFLSIKLRFRLLFRSAPCA
jgi:hypothetical protein